MWGSEIKAKIEIPRVIESWTRNQQEAVKPKGKLTVAQRNKQARVQRRLQIDPPAVGRGDGGGGTASDPLER